MKAGYPQAKVDEVMGEIDHLPESLVQAYYDMVKEDIANRVHNDNDYKARKSGTGRSGYDDLDRL